MCLEDFVGGDDTTGTTAMLMNAEIADEVIDQQCKEKTADLGPTGVDDITQPQTSSDVAASAVLRRYWSAIEGSVLTLVDSLDYTEQAVAMQAVANKMQATLLQFVRPK